MSKYLQATNNALTVKVWQERLFKDALVESYFNRFMGTGSDSIVHVDTKLEKGKGDNVTFGIRMRGTGAGVTGDESLEGKEESLTTHDYSLSLQMYRHAFKYDAGLTEQRASFNLPEQNRMAIKEWGAEKIDRLCFEALLDATPTRVAYLTNTGVANYANTGTASTAFDALTTSSKLEPYFISYCKTIAKTGLTRSFVPMRPVKIDGKEYFVLLVHPDVMFDLKINSVFQQAMREARERSKENPLFQGATAIWDGVVIHEHELVTKGTDAGSGNNVPYAKCALLGAQALCWAWGRRPRLIEESFDYKKEIGNAWEIIAGTGKPKFNSEDYGSLGVYVARTNISG